MQILVPQASRNEVPNPKNPILKNDWKICPKKEGQGFLEQVEVRHATLKGGTLANAANSCASCSLAIANAHAVLARCCTLKLPRCSSATLANAANSCASCWLAVANAHAVLARSCTLKSPKRSSAALANTANSCASD